MLLIDTIYSIVYFRYTYFFELKRRFAVMSKGMPTEYRMILHAQIRRENGFMRTLIQSAYIPWIVTTIFLQLWYLPVIVTVCMALTNLIYRKPYISPYILYFNLLVMISSFGYGLISLFLLR